MSETKEPKIARKGILMALGIICIIMAASLGSAVAAANLQEQSFPNATYTVVGTLSYANVSAVYSGVIVDSINPSFSPNLVGSFMFLTFNGQLSWTFPAGFVSGNVVVINGTISFDDHSQTYLLNWINGSLYSNTVTDINEQLGLQLTIALEKTDYILGEPINVTFTVTNNNNQTIDFLYEASTFDFLVYNDTGFVYQWSRFKVFPLFVVILPLDPGQNITRVLTWPQTCNVTEGSQGVPVSPGMYQILGQIPYYGLQAGPMGVNVVLARLPGDINGDGKVNLVDLVIFARAYGSKPGDPNWNPPADILGHGKVDIADLVQLAEHYGQHYP